MADPIQYATTDEALTDTFPNIASDNTEKAALIGRLLVAASSLIDRYTDRPPGYFAPTPEVTDDAPKTVRRMRGSGTNYLRLGRHVPGSVEIHGFTSEDFYEDVSTGWVFAMDRINEAAGPGGAFADPQRSNYDDRPYCPQRAFVENAVYQVKARWGFAETPADIVLACKMIAQHIYDRGQGTFGQVTPSGFIIERDVPPPVRLILNNWKRKDFEIN